MVSASLHVSTCSAHLCGLWLLLIESEFSPNSQIGNMPAGGYKKVLASNISDIKRWSEELKDL